MRLLAVLLMVLLISSCALPSYEVQKAPMRRDKAVVFDIDGTLTPTPMAIFTAREDAAEAVRAYADDGYKIIYLSARVRQLQSGIPGWLEAHHFPEGSIHVPQNPEDSSDPAAFKKRILDTYKARGWRLVAGFGDSSTDFQAYRDAGLQKNRIFALKHEGETSCQPGTWARCLNSWSEYLKEVYPGTGVRKSRWHGE
ncbi:LNS2 domain-containing protein [Thiolapillus brandeum]|nr:hypothetical protein [Thiolapillus brandeum]